MRVAVYYSNSDVRVEEMDVPEIGPGELLMKVVSSGICGSDLMEWYRAPKAPLVLGHETAGVVEKVGPGVERFKPGDRIVATHHVPCNTCYHCLRGNHSSCRTLRSTHFDPGGFAEYVRVPAVNVDRGVFLLPPEVSFDEGSFVEPLGCVVRGQLKADVPPGSTVLVVGSGMTGLLHVQLARALGASVVVATDVNPFRLEAARRMGADAALAADGDVAAELRRLTGGRLADFVVVCTGAETALRGAFDLVEEGGAVLLFAPSEPSFTLELPFNELWWKGVKVLSSYAAAPADLALALELIRSGRVRVKEMVTHRLPLEEIQRGFDLVRRAKDSIKVIIDPTL